MRNKNLRGMTLTELAIVLGAMGLIMAAVWTIVGTVWDGYRFQKMNQQIQTASQAIQDYYGNIGGVYQPGTKTPYGNNDDISSVVDDDDRRLIPIEMRIDKMVEASGLRHAMGGAFRVESIDNGGGVRFLVDNMKKEHCIRLLMEFPVLVPEMGVTLIGTQGEEVTVDPNNAVDPTPTSAVELPMTLTTATAWCDDDTDNEVRIDFKVRK